MPREAYPRQRRRRHGSPARPRLEVGEDGRVPLVDDSGQRRTQAGCTGPFVLLGRGLKAARMRLRAGLRRAQAAGPRRRRAAAGKE
jgi:hypothetical protein